MKHFDTRILLSTVNRNPDKYFSLKITTSESQSGMFAVEFAVIASVFALFIFSVFGVGSYLTASVAANNAARQLGRLAAVCSPSSMTSTFIASKVTNVTNLNASNITVTYTPSGCTTNNSCTSVTVTIPTFDFPLPTPALFPITVKVPANSITVVREGMSTMC